MAGGGNFIARVMQYVVNEFVVSGLANSRAFQRFAVRTSKKMEDLSKMAAENREKVVQHMEEVARNIEKKR